MMYWSLWLLPVRQKYILIYDSHLCVNSHQYHDLNQELWPTWRCASATSNTGLFITPMESLAKGREEPQSKTWTPPSTPVSSWNLLNPFLFSKLIEKGKKFCGRLRNRERLSCPRGSWVMYFMEMPLKEKNSFLPLQQPEIMAKIPSVLQLPVCSLTRGKMLPMLIRLVTLEKLYSLAQGSQGWENRGNTSLQCQP